MHSRVHEEDVVGNGEVESHATGFKADQKHLHPRVLLERLQHLLQRRRGWPKAKDTVMSLPASRETRLQESYYVL